MVAEIARTLGAVIGLWIVLWIVGFALVAGIIVLYTRFGRQWKYFDRSRDPRASLDERGVTYGTRVNETTIPWEELTSVSLYYGEPDFPDPMVGNAPVREWHFRGRGRSHEIDGYFLDGKKVAKWCARRLPGFDANAALAAWSSDAVGMTALWRRHAGDGTTPTEVRRT